MWLLCFLLLLPIHCTFYWQDEDVKPKAQKKEKVKERCEAELQEDDPLSVLTAIIAQVCICLTGTKVKNDLPAWTAFPVLSTRSHRRVSYWISWASSSWIKLDRPGTKSLGNNMVPLARFPYFLFLWSFFFYNSANVNCFLCFFFTPCLVFAVP